ELPAWTETSNTCTTKTAGHDVPKERKLAANDHTGGRVLANWRWFRPAVPAGCVPIVNDVTPPVDPLNVMMRPPPFAPVDRPDAGMVVPSTGRPKNRGFIRWFVRFSPDRFGPWYEIVSPDATTYPSSPRYRYVETNTGSPPSTVTSSSTSCSRVSLPCVQGSTPWPAKYRFADSCTTAGSYHSAPSPIDQSFCDRRHHVPRDCSPAESDASNWSFRTWSASRMYGWAPLARRLKPIPPMPIENDLSVDSRAARAPARPRLSGIDSEMSGRVLF